MARLPGRTSGRWSSIRWRLVAVLAGVSLFTLLVVGAVFYFFLGDYLLERNKDLLLDQALEVAEQVQGVEESLRVDVLEAKVITALLRADLQVLPAGAGIAVFKGPQSGGEGGHRAGQAGIPGTHAGRGRGAGSRGGRQRRGRGRSRRRGRPEGDRAPGRAPVELSDGTEGLAVVTLARADAFAARTGVFRALLISGVIAIVLAVLVGLGLGAWMTRPLRRLSAAARRMAAGLVRAARRPARIRARCRSWPTAWRPCARRCERSEESLRGFVASAAHELRTPLTSIQGFSQALLDGTADTPEQQQRSAAAIHRESTRLRRLVDALLTLSRYDSREFRPTMTSVDVDALVAEEVERLVQAGPGRTADASPCTAEPGTHGDHRRATCCGRWLPTCCATPCSTGANDPVTVRVDADGRDLTLEVANGGEPLDRGRESADLRTLLPRRRPAGGWTGSGSASRWCGRSASVLGGRVELVEEGPLTRFRVTLPCAARGAGPDRLTG